VSLSPLQTEDRQSYSNLTGHKTVLEYFMEDIIMEGTFLHVVRCDVSIKIAVLYVTPFSVVEQHQCFTEMLPSIKAQHESTRLNVMVPLYQTVLCYS
jgi:hypothetical protein